MGQGNLSAFRRLAKDRLSRLNEVSAGLARAWGSAAPAPRLPDRRSASGCSARLREGTHLLTFDAARLLARRALTLTASGFRPPVGKAVWFPLGFEAPLGEVGEVALPSQPPSLVDLGRVLPPFPALPAGPRAYLAFHLHTRSETMI